MNDRPYWWSGPIGGLGNRLIALATMRACAGERVIHFPWSVDPSCPGDYADILKPMPCLAPGSKPLPGSIELETHNWEPLTIYQQLNAALDLNLPLPEFCRRFVSALRSLPFHDEFKGFTSGWRAAAGDVPLVGVHIRRTDRAAYHRDQFRAFLMRKQGMNRELPLHLSALYGLCPAPAVRAYENAAVASALRRYGKKAPGFHYAVFSDATMAEHSVVKTAARLGVSNKKHFTYASGADDAAQSNSARLEHLVFEASQSNALESLLRVLKRKTGDPLFLQRQTTIKDAVMDLLCLAQCDAIAQGNRASTFSLVAALIGAKPIITGKPRYPFWIAIEAETKRTMIESERLNICAPTREN